MITNLIAIHEFFIALGITVALYVFAAFGILWLTSYPEEEKTPDDKPPTHTDNH